MRRLKDFDTRPRYGHNHNGVYEPLWSKITYMAHANRHVMVRRPHCEPFVLTEKQWLEFPLWSDRPAGRSALAQSEEGK